MTRAEYDQVVAAVKLEEAAKNARVEADKAVEAISPILTEALTGKAGAFLVPGTPYAVKLDGLDVVFRRIGGFESLETLVK